MFARPNGLRENAETAISCRGPGPTRKKEVYQQWEEGEEDARTCPCGKAIESRSGTVGECKMHKKESDVLEEMRK